MVTFPKHQMRSSIPSSQSSPSPSSSPSSPSSSTQTQFTLLYFSYFHRKSKSTRQFSNMSSQIIKIHCLYCSHSIHFFKFMDNNSYHHLLSATLIVISLRALSITPVVICGKDYYQHCVDKKIEQLDYFSKITVTEFFKPEFKSQLSLTPKHSFLTYQAVC